MFDNIGGKIKGIAKFICYLGILLSVTGGTIIFFFGIDTETNLFWIGLLVIAGGALSSWLGSLATYGFGELIENSTIIAELMAKADAEKSNGK